MSAEAEDIKPKLSLIGEVQVAAQSAISSHLTDLLWGHVQSITTVTIHISNGPCHYSDIVVLLYC